MEVFKNSSCFIDYRLLMRYRIFLNFCVWQETILHNMTTLSDSKYVQKCRSYYERPFLHRHFSIKIDGIFKNCSCFIDYYTLDALSDPLYLLHITRGHTALQKSVDRINIGSKNVGFIYERPFVYRLFFMKIDGTFKNCSCFIDYRLLMLYRIRRNFCVLQETILHNMTTLSESKSVKKK